MNEKKLKELIEQGLSTRQLAFRLATSQTNVRYWLKKLDLRTHQNPYNKGARIEREDCSLCGKKQDPKRDYYTKKCWACCTQIRRLRIRIAAFAYKGGKCVRCGRSDGPYDAYDFHHIRDKEFAIGRAHCVSTKRLRAELDKCILLCAFCHRVEHSVEKSGALWEEVDKKQLVI